MSHSPIFDPDTPARVFELIRAFARGEVQAGGEIVELIPPDELVQVAAFALGMLGGLYAGDQTCRRLIDRASTQS